MIYWPEEFLLKDQLLSLWGSDCMIFMSLFLLLLMFVFLCVCLNFQCLVKILGCFTFGSSTSEHSAVLGLRELFPSPFNRGFQLSSLEEFSQAPCHPFFFFPFLSFFLSFFPFGLFHVEILTVGHLILSKNYQSFSCFHY